MKFPNTTLVLSALGVALLATPALAQRPHQQQTQNQSTQFPGIRNDVVVDGRFQGTDADPSMPLEMRRDAEGDTGPFVGGY
jgi:hypothetical protein